MAAGDILLLVIGCRDELPVVMARYRLKLALPPNREISWFFTAIEQR